jgi:type IV pilus assembly protein PilA
MTKLHARKGGFTLIELMIVVAIIGILAAIAIPNFLRFQLRSKTGEAKTNLAAMRTAEEGYFAEYSVYVAAAQNPAGAPVAQKRAWGAAPAGFDTLGWAPEGDVFFVYGIDNPVGMAHFSLGASGNLDGAGNTSDFGYIHPDAAGVAVAATVGACPAAGVFAQGPGGVPVQLRDTVGPCAQQDGQSEF